MRTSELDELATELVAATCELDDALLSTELALELELDLDDCFTILIFLLLELVELKAEVLTLAGVTTCELDDL
ncbi:hypothetical protein FC45_GL000641 [Lactobacillus jensenii DSM 20557]|nr:hypothetical protein FC45_GL000641 [Lactobacillus jensenii DSM 20557]